MERHVGSRLGKLSEVSEGTPHVRCPSFLTTPLYCLSKATLRQMEIPRLGVESELLAYATATAMPDLSHVCNLQHRSQQCQSLNPLSEARMEPASSGMLVGFITTEPQREHLLILLVWACS